MIGSTLSSHERTVSIAVMIASISSIIFAVFMIGGYVFIPSLRTFRHCLILGLAIAEFFLALNFFAATFSALVGHHPLSSPLSSTFCSFSGFITQIFFMMIDCWVLAIAVMTYLTIAEKTRMSTFVQRHQVWLWIAIWSFSIACASVGFGIWAYSDVGGFCWFESAKLRLIVNYAPRWIVIIVNMALYCRTFVLIRRAQRRGLIRAARGQGPPPTTLSNPSTTTTNAPMPPTAPASSADSATLYSGGSVIAQQESSYAILARQRERERHHDRLRRTSFLMTAYPVCYAILWGIPTVIMLYQICNLGEDHLLPLGLDCLSKVTIALNGFISGHIYGFNERSQIAWVNLIINTMLRTKKAERRPGNANGEQVDDWNAHSHAVDKLQIEGRTTSEQRQPSVTSTVIDSRRVDIEKGPTFQRREEDRDSAPLLDGRGT